MSFGAMAGQEHIVEGVDWREDWARMFGGMEEETDYEITDVDGVIPADVPNGSFFRNGPGFFELNGHQIHPIDGDGMIVRIAFADGRVSFRNRYVKTQGYESEKAAGKVLYRGVFGTTPKSWLLKGAFNFPPKFKNVANTALVHLPSQGRILALYEGGLPHAIDSASLDTIGVDTMGGHLGPDAIFTAHPVLCPKTGTLWSFGVYPGRFLTAHITEYDVTGPEPRVLQERRVRLKGFAAVIHSFVVTENWVVLIQNPVSFSIKKMVLGYGVDDWMQADLDEKSVTLAYLLPRRQETIAARPQKPGAKEKGPRVATVALERGFTYHHANAFEEGGDVVVDSVVYQHKPPLDMMDTSEGSNALSAISASGPGRLMRYRIPAPSSAGMQAGPPVRAEVLPGPESCEMPILAPRLAGSRHRFVYAVRTTTTASGPGPGPWTALTKTDLQEGTVETWELPPRHFTGEPAFVPRTGSTAEDDGYLMAFIFDAAREQSVLQALDARTMEPTFALTLKKPVPFSFHCSWVPWTPDQAPRSRL